jgi:hypothetical protein
MGSSRWFIIAGVIVRQDEGPNVSHTIDRIKDRLQWSRDPIRRRRALHWRKLGHAQKPMVSGELAQEPLTSVHVCMWKERFSPNSPLRDSELLYHYSLRLLLERVSWFVHGHNGQMRVIVSNRARFSLDGVREYVRVLQSDPRFQGRHVFDPDDLTVTRPDLRKMLQIADAFACATLNALNPNQYGDTEPRYLQRIAGCLYRHGASRRLWSYGLKIFPSDGATRQAVLDVHAWLRDFLRA